MRLSHLIDTDWIIHYLIASTCLHHKIALLTNNRKHYEVVDSLNIFSLS
jgi:predicted nucleic acid-binding protein